MSRKKQILIGAGWLFFTLAACSEESPEPASMDASVSADMAVALDAAADMAVDVTVDAAPEGDVAVDEGSVDMAAPDMLAPDAGPPPELEWVLVPAGSYEMGCSPGDEQCDDIELPVHRVEIAAFELNPREINQHEYLAYAGYNPSFYYECGDDCPVDQITWYEAHDFCEQIGGRLPTEAEWEYAARAGATTRYPCGDDAACLDDIAWYAGNAEAETHPGGTKMPNAFGLYDILGNVWEWVEDCWHDDYTMNPPLDGSAWLGDDCTYRVVRGGNWGLDGRGLRVSNRDGDYPDTYLLPPPGFRCARDLENP